MAGRRSKVDTGAAPETNVPAKAKGPALPGHRVWKLEDAKARFSEVVRRARSEGPQRVTHRGTDAVVVVSADDFKQLVPEVEPRQNIVEFLRGTSLGELDLERPKDRGRTIRF
jgi:prevent-host-death family protein